MVTNGMRLFMNSTAAGPMGHVLCEGHVYTVGSTVPLDMAEQLILAGAATVLGDDEKRHCPDGVWR